MKTENLKLTRITKSYQSKHCHCHQQTEGNVITFESYADCLMTSGAIQKGVPTKVFLLLVVLVSCPATPKSANLTSPISLSRTLAAVKVRNLYKKLKWIHKT